MRNEEYWKRRQAEKLDSAIKNAVADIEEVKRFYHKAYLYTDKQIEGIFESYRNHHRTDSYCVLSFCPYLFSFLSEPYHFAVSFFAATLDNALIPITRKRSTAATAYACSVYRPSVSSAYRCTESVLAEVNSP